MRGFNNACDINNDEWCDNGEWNDEDYCSKCGNKDSSCLFTCQENACGTTSNQRCSNGAWTSDDYCDYCALEDSDCSISCAEGECDAVNRKVCASGEWVESSYTDLCGYQEVIVPVKTCNDYGNCTIGSTCTTDPECSNGFCYNYECAEPTCDDGVLNGNETDKDCGGGCESKCELGRNCWVNEDCGSNFMCASGACTEVIPVVETIPEEEDSDGDGIPDEWEIEHGLDIFDPSDAYADFDEDELTNIQEYTFGTNPNIADSDGDSVSDSEEIIRENTDPLDPVSKPGGIGGLLIWTVVLIIVFGGGSYAVYYYKDFLINLVRPGAVEEQIPIPRQVPLKRQYVPHKPVLKISSKKTRIEEIIEKRREVKREKRKKLLEPFVGKNAPKQRKTSSTKEGIFSILRSTSKKRK